MTSWLRAALTLALASRLAGCATQRETIVYPGLPPGLRVEKAPQAEVARRCGERVKHFDDGREVPWGHRFHACYLGAENLILIAWGWMRLLAHELCHASGRPALECAEVY